MLPLLGQVILLAFIAWLLVRDLRNRPGVSSMTWVVVLWTIIFASRSASQWLSTQGSESVEAYMGGSPVDRAVFIALMLGGLTVLLYRRVGVGHLIRANRWLFALYAYFLLSTAWSDFPFVALKRWFRESGNLIMILVLLSEKDPVEAIKATFLRCAYVLVPLSVLFVRFKPDLGRIYTGFNGNDLMYVGVSTHKNTLGALLVVSLLFITWELLERRTLKSKVRRTSLARMDLLVLLLMTLWLLRIANSATSLVCAVIGVGIVMATGLDAIRRRIRYFWPFAIAAGALWVLVESAFGLTELIVTSLGRDMTMTTRTEVWPLLLNSAVNPVFGAGFKSFWAGERMARVWATVGSTIVQAHNGYIETYLEGGLVAVALLLGALFTSIRTAQRHIVDGRQGFSRVCFAILIVALVYNFSEAAFTQRSVLWIAVLAAVTVPSVRRETEPVNVPKHLVRGSSKHFIFVPAVARRTTGGHLGRLAQK